MISIDETLHDPVARARLLEKRPRRLRIRGERRPGKVKLLPLRDLEEQVDLRRPDFDVVVEEQNPVILQQEVRPELEQPADGGVLAAALIDDRFRLRIGGRFVVIVEENVVGARLGEIGCVEPLPGLNVDKPAPSGRFDSRSIRSARRRKNGPAAPSIPAG